MSKYHKITELSTLLEIQKRFNRFIGYFGKERFARFLTGSITIISLASLMLNFLFPHIALANDIGKNNVLSFDYSKSTSILSYSTGKTDKEQRMYALPIEKTIQIQTLGAMAIVAENNDLAVSPAEIRDQIAELICAEAGITDLPCWQDLKAMREKESYDGKAMVGDGGRSRGWYHIQTKLHGISKACALDFKCSTEWTVKNLIANGYETNRVYAISRHNGSGVMAQRYAKSVVRNSAEFE